MRHQLSTVRSPPPKQVLLLSLFKTIVVLITFTSRPELFRLAALAAGGVINSQRNKLRILLSAYYTTSITYSALSK
jgi:hypothetical protein